MLNFIQTKTEMILNTGISLNIGYTADGFYRSDDPTNSVKALKEGG